MLGRVPLVGLAFFALAAVASPALERRQDPNDPLGRLCISTCGIALGDFQSCTSSIRQDVTAPLHDSCCAANSYSLIACRSCATLAGNTTAASQAVQFRQVLLSQCPDASSFVSQTAAGGAGGGSGLTTIGAAGNQITLSQTATGLTGIGATATATGSIAQSVQATSRTAATAGLATATQFTPNSGTDAVKTVRSAAVAAVGLLVALAVLV